MPGNGAVGASYGDLLATSLVVLVGVCVAAFVVVRLAGRFALAGRARGAHLLEIVARLPLEPRRSLYVVQVAGKTLLVGTSEMGLSLLSELDGAAVGAQVAARPSFGELVRTAWAGRGGRAGGQPGDTVARAELAGNGGDDAGRAAASEGVGHADQRARVGAPRPSGPYEPAAVDAGEAP